jgi:hypothetical protein
MPMFDADGDFLTGGYGDAAAEAAMAWVWTWQCAPKARIISGGRIHPESCRLFR